MQGFASHRSLFRFSIFAPGALVAVLELSLCPREWPYAAIEGNGVFSSSSDCPGGISAIIYYVITGIVIFDVKNKTGGKTTL